MSENGNRRSERVAGAGLAAPVDARLLYRDSADPGLPEPRGLYDPALAKDSCGVGFIADIKGRKSHKIVEDALTILLNLEHRGAVGADPRAGDGAGILTQIPHKFFARKAGGARHHAARAGRIWHRRSVHAARRRAARDRAPDLRAGRSARRPDHPRLAHRHPDRQLDARRVGEADRALPHASFHWKGKKEAQRGRVRARALHPAQVDLVDDLPPVRAAAVGLLPGVDLLPHGHLQGHVPRRPARHLLPRPARAGLRERARARAPALLHQHLPDLVAGASLPHDRPQRRDQHAARQQQLDGGAAGLGLVEALRRRHLTSSGRSPTRASPTPPASTTRSNSWCRAATRSRTP